ncbi:MAG: hypothetical protein HY080_08180 [Gammaproteobacteria bacterium]|nr:hypothetical protein [Gammaproteobacteria bacterium]
MERFFKSYKEEWMGDQAYYTRDAAMHAHMKWYDSVRLYSTQGYQTLMECENDLNKVSGMT